MPTFRHGALYVVSGSDPNDQLLKDLKAIDPRLFFEKQIDFKGDQVWCVVCDLGTDHPPVTLLEWRDENGRPIPHLASGILDRMGAMERDAGRLTQRVIERNKAFRADIERKMQEQIAESVFDHVPLITGKRSPMLFRSQALRMARDKKRAKGWKV